LKSPRNGTGLVMTSLHRSPPVNQSKTDLGIRRFEGRRMGVAARFPT
jgi:hypothetical protein